MLLNQALKFLRGFPMENCPHSKVDWIFGAHQRFGVLSKKKVTFRPENPCVLAQKWEDSFIIMSWLLKVLKTEVLIYKADLVLKGTLKREKIPFGKSKK